MVQPKYSPEDALQRVKLMMGYDTKKTLKENIREIGVVLNEQESAGNTANTVRDITHYLMGDVQSSDLTNIQDILDTKVIGKTFKDGTCLMSKVIEYFARGGNSRFSDNFTTLAGFSGTGNDLIKSIQATEEGGESEFEDVKKDLIDSINKELNGFCKTGGKKEDELKKDEDCAKNPNQEKCKKTDDSKKKTSGYTLCTGTYKYACKTDPSDAIGKVQSCLGGLVVDGKFGPKTRDKLSAKGFTTFTDADVDKICSTQIVAKLGSDVESQTLGQDQNDVDSNTNTPSNPNQQDSTTKTGIS
jgi:hypothetical protein